MARSCVGAREATLDDLPELLGMWAELREAATPSEQGLAPESRRQLLARLLDLQRDPETRVLVAAGEETLAGMAVLSCRPAAEHDGAEHDGSAVHVDYLHVRGGFRRRGVGHVLLGAAVAYADECAAEHVVVSVPPELGESRQRYARFGFGPRAFRRACSVTALRRHLATEGSTPEGRNPLADGLIARRRLVQARLRSRPLTP